MPLHLNGLRAPVDIVDRRAEQSVPAPSTRDEARPRATAAAPLDPRLLLMHQVMLGDRVRLDAYDRALAAIVRPDDVVVDVGAGTAILSLLALRNGARRVYAIEADDEMAAIARIVVRSNGLDDRVVVMHGDARRVRLPEQADVLVTEMMGNLGPEEEMAEIVGVAAERFLRRGGRLIPEHVATYVQAVELDDEGWGVWRDDFRGYSLRAVQEHAPARAQLHFFNRPARALSAPARAAACQLGDGSPPPSSPLALEITTSGTLHAVIGYFEATLASDIALSNYPSYAGCNWAVWLWPLRHTTVRAGELVRVGLHRPSPADLRLAAHWTLTCDLLRREQPAG